MIEYTKYKPYIKNYLQMKGVNLVENGRQTLCCCIFHQEKTPSMIINNNEQFFCFGCHKQGDIVDCVKELEGYTEEKDAINFLEETFFGNSSVEVKKYNPIPKEEKKISPELEKQFDNFLKTRINQNLVRQFFMNRKQYQNEQLPAYKREIVDKLVPYFGFYPGKDEAIKYFTENELEELGIKNFYSPALTLKLKKGWRFHNFATGGKKYTNKKGEEKKGKYGSFGSHIFPPAYNVDFEKPIIITEGELDALILRACGYENAYSAMGTSGITTKTADFFKNAKEIILFLDNDKAGKDATREITTILQNQTNATIKIAKVEEIAPCKDPDEAIQWGYLDKVTNAIQNATTPESSKKEDEKNKENGKEIKHYGLLTKREVVTLLNHLPKNTITQEEIKLLSQALINASGDIKTTKFELKKWGLDEKDIPELTDTDPKAIIISLGKKYNFHRMYIKRLKEKEYSYSSDGDYSYLENNLLIKVNIDDFKDTDELNSLMTNKFPVMEAVLILSKIFEDKIICVGETIKKEWYFFDGLTWQYRSDINRICHDTLRECVNQYYGSKKAGELTLAKVTDIRFCEKVSKELSTMTGIFQKSVNFDSHIIKETLTLDDCVFDFSGKKAIFRDARPEEYRKEKLPYSKADFEKRIEPKEFLKFMNSNFDNKETLNSLMFYLSTIPSRNVAFKVGGIFTGITHTGKSTTVNLLSRIYPKMIVPIPRNFIMNSKSGNNDAGTNPFLLELEGKGAGVSDETEKNDKLNSTEFKKLTSKGERTARQLYGTPHTFIQTAQTIICTNYAPLFDSSDTAVVDRMFIVQFSKQHKKGEKGTMDEDDLFKLIEPEFPSVIQLFAEYYIQLKTQFKMKIPDSAECKAYKNDYIERMDENGLQGFVQKYIVFAKGSGKWIPLKEVYNRYCMYWNIELDDSGKPKEDDKLTQAKFTRYLKRDYNEFKVTQKRINGYPTQIVMDLEIKEWTEVPEDNITTNAQAQQTTQNAEKQQQIQSYQNQFANAPSIEEENPFEGMTPSPAFTNTPKDKKK